MCSTTHEERAGVHFQLRPFTVGPMTENLSISGCLARRPGVVEIGYRVDGALGLVSWPGTTQLKGRCHELWRQSCFELFLGIRGNTAYWEVNLSPNDCWNMYSFTDHRTGMREESSVAQPFCRVVEDGTLFSLSCSIDLTRLIDDSSDLEVGVSSVLWAIDGSTSYWALEHHGRQPDFHNRASFCLALPGMGKLNNI